MSAQRASQLVEAGLWLRLSGDHEGARRLFEQALKLDPSNARARQLLDAPAPVPAPQPTGAAKMASELDWGGATGHAPTPPPVAPVSEPAPQTRSRPFGEGAPLGTHTVRLGEAEAPEIPDVPRFEDPHGEVMITGADERAPDNATLVYGMSGVPVPPAPSSNTPQGGTMVFGKGGSPPQVPPVSPVGGGTLVFGSKDAVSPASPGAPSGGTLVFGSKDAASPASPGVPPGGTLVFGSKDAVSAPSPAAPPGGTLVFGAQPGAPVSATPVARPGGGTLVFGAERSEPQPPAPSPRPGGGTLVFGAERPEPQPPAASPRPGGGTLVFGTDRSEPQLPASPRPGAGTLVFGATREPAEPGKGTIVFGSTQGSGVPPPVPPVNPGNSTLAFGSVPPSIAPLASPRDAGVVTEPGLPEFDVDDFAAPPASEPPTPGTSSTGTLEFNFDDMVASAGPPPPVPSPGVPQDKGDAPQTAWDKSNPRIDISQIELEPGQGGGFDIIAAEPAPPPKQRSPQQLKAEISTLLSGAKDLLDLDDHSGAMELIGKALELDPSEPAALKLKDRSERTLQAMYESKLGDLNQIPRVKLKEDEIIWLNLDHRAGFVLAQIDGHVSFEEIFAVSGMSRLDTARILAQLVEEGVISKG